MIKTVLLFILIAAFARATFAGEGVTFFKSDLAGKDLPFSDAALVENTGLVKGGILDPLFAGLG